MYTIVINIIMPNNPLTNSFSFSQDQYGDNAPSYWLNG